MLSNVTKWLVAIPFSFLVAFAIPAMIYREWLWFVGMTGPTIYVVLTASMWLIATAFVDVNKPRGKPDLANKLISSGLILSVPIAVADHRWGVAAHTGDGVIGAALCIAICAMVIGIWARKKLGEAYAPRARAEPRMQLVQQGPYRYIRHPLYTGALLWSISWPLFMKSLIAATVTLLFVAPAIIQRIKSEERELLRVYGDDYREYKERSWRLIPLVY